jgi:hypothetical protein
MERFDRKMARISNGATVVVIFFMRQSTTTRFMTKEA